MENALFLQTLISKKYFLSISCILKFWSGAFFSTNHKLIILLWLRDRNFLPLCFACLSLFLVFWWAKARQGGSEKKLRWLDAAFCSGGRTSQTPGKQYLLQCCTNVSLVYKSVSFSAPLLLKRRTKIVQNIIKGKTVLFLDIILTFQAMA